MVVWAPCNNCQRYAKEMVNSMDSEAVENMDEYGFRTFTGDIVMPCGHTFLLNHSCEPNVIDFGLDFGIAVRTILPGQQITIDYSTFYADDHWEFQCKCGTKNCRNRIYPNRELTLELQISNQEIILDALRKLKTVEQPLHHTLMDCSKQYRSIMNCDSQEIIPGILNNSVLK